MCSTKFHTHTEQKSVMLLDLSYFLLIINTMFKHNVKYRSAYY